MAGIISKINGQKGGRPKGSKSKKTLAREAAEKLESKTKEEAMKAYTRRVVKITGGILTKQIHLITGQSFLYRIDKEWIKTHGKDGYWKKLKPVLVENTSEIQEYLERSIVNEESMEDSGESGSAYYYITTKEPDVAAMREVLNRVYGAPRQALELSGALSINDLLEQAEKNR